MKKKRTIMLVIQIVLTLVVGFSIFSSTQRQLDPVTVYSYGISTDESGRALEDKDIVAVEVPRNAVMEGFELKKENIVGKYVDRKVSKGQFIYSDHLIEKEHVDIFKKMDLSNMRKVSLPINFVEGFAGNLRKGDMIDLAYVGAGATDDSSFSYSKVFMQDVPVWSVNTGSGHVFHDRSQETAELYEADEGINDDEGDLQIITLAVTLEQAEEILARQKSGQISFVGRFDGSENKETLGFVMGDYEKIFSGRGHAETGRTFIEEDNFEEMIKEKDIDKNKDNNK